MDTDTKRYPLGAGFKRPLQKPLVGACEMISWASANLMFDGIDDDLEAGLRGGGGRRFCGAED